MRSHAAHLFSEPAGPPNIQLAGDGTDRHPGTPLSRLRLSELEASIRVHWYEHAGEAVSYPETLVRALLLSAAQPQETVWHEAVTTALKAALHEYQTAGLARVAACMKLNKLAMCISTVVSSAPLDLVSAATLVETANGVLLDGHHELWEAAAQPAFTLTAKAKTS